MPSLILKITSYQSQTLGADSNKTFTELGGTIGRAQDNDWVLPDPEHYLSGHHASISFQDGVFYLTDTSINGVFINGAAEPMGNGNTVVLSNGDRLNLSNYEVEVSIDAGLPESDLSGPWAAPAEADTGEQVVITSPTGRPDMPESLDPLASTGKPAAGTDEGFLDPFALPPEQPGAEPDHVSPLSESFQPPGAGIEQIPDDWDLTDYSSVPGEQGGKLPGGEAAPVPAPSPGAAKHEAPPGFPAAADHLLTTATTGDPDTTDDQFKPAHPGEVAGKSVCAVDEDVQFTVYRPRSVVPGEWHDLFAFAHNADRFQEVQQQAMRLLRERAPDYSNVTADSTEAIPQDSLITFAPYIPGVQFNPPTRSFLWTEAVHLELFRLRAHSAFDGKRVSGRLSVFLGSILIAEVSLSFRVAYGERPERDAESVDRAEAQPYRKIFPSYAHEDTPIVEQFERYARSLGDDYLRDVMTLRAGEVWDERLRKLIAQADVFQLFWSRHSMASRFVRDEWERALALERAHFIRPVYWEEPFPSEPEEGLPPPALSRLHFQRIAWAAPDLKP